MLLGASAQAGINLTRTSSSFGGSHGSAGANSGATGTSQTATAATSATAGAAQTTITTQRAQVSLLRSIQALQTIQAQQNAQAAARNLALSTNPSVPDGLATGGLVPGVAGTDPANPATIANTVPITTSASGTSITLGANNSITLPPNATGNSQITVSGTGTVGSITTGNTITSLTGGVATTIAPGSTISLTNGGTIDFAAGSAVVPSSVNTYAYTGASGTVPVPVSWTGVGGLSQSNYASGAKTVTVTQTSQQALLTWQSFNIGQNTTLDFDQSLGGGNVGSWVAINKVAAGIAPSQILGSVQAPGQVYVLNQNGIIFTGTSQLNLGALVASSLPINTNLVSLGLLNNPDDQFTFSQIDIPAGASSNAFSPQEDSPAPTTGTVAQVSSTGTVTTSAASGFDGDVIVQPGAQITSPTTPEHVGGKIALIGPNVDNGGTLSSADGQIILAAGLQVEYLQSTDPSLRGLNIEVGEVSDPGYDGGAAISGTAINLGDIEADRADTFMTGENVNQLGVIDSTTSVSLNGRVDLVANYGAEYLVNNLNGFFGQTGLYFSQSGNVTLGAGSLTQIQPEYSSTDEVVSSAFVLPSQMNFQGKNIYLGANSQVLAPNANITFNAGDWLADSAGFQFFNDAGQVYLDQNATVDVSGTENASASVTDNVIPVQLLGTELADSPLQQDGALRGLTVDVDIRQLGTYDGTPWIGTPLGDVSGYVNLITHTVGQLTTNGGTVTIKAGSSVVMQDGSVIDVSGGWINYAGGTVDTTQVISNGIVYDISQATPDRVYSGVYGGGYSTGSAKWDIYQNFGGNSNAVYQDSYLQGGNGGSISITAPSMALDGSLQGATVAGALQNTPLSQLQKTYGGSNFLTTAEAIYGVPQASSLSLTFAGANGADAADTFAPYSPTPPSITFQNGTISQVAVGAFSTDPTTDDPGSLPAARQQNVILSPDLVNQDGFGSLAIVNEDGSITVPAGVSLTTPLGGSLSSGGVENEGGSITFNAANITIGGSVASPGGNLAFTVYDFSPYTILGPGASTPSADGTRGKFILDSSGSLSTAGLVIDQSTSGSSTLPLVIDGGAIGIAGYDTELMAGSVINSSGGAVITAADKQTFGKGGSISVSGGQDVSYSGLLGGQLVLDSTLEAYSGTSGGSLAITAPLIQIGGDSLQNGDSTGSGQTLWLDATDSSGNLLEPEFFSQGGFGSFSLAGLGAPILSGANPVYDSAGNQEFMPAILIAAQAKVDPVAQSWRVVGSSGNFSLQSVTLPLASERTPVSLAFTAKGVTDSQTGLLIDRGDFVMGTGASIITDPETSATRGVGIKAQTAAVLGSISVPGGSISISGGGSFPITDNISNQILFEPTVDLGPQSNLSTQGAVELTVNTLGYTTGSVLGGGNITVSGDIVAEAGSVLNVSGATGVLDVPAAEAGQVATISSTYVPLREDSNGGSITLSGGQELFTDATLLGAAGGPTAQGGSLSVSSGIYLATNTVVQTPLSVTLLVTQSGATIPVPDYYPAGETAIGNPVVDSQGNVVAGMGHFSVDSFDNPTSGFSSLTLAGTVQFQGPIDLTASSSLKIATNLKSPSGGIIFADSQVNLSAPYVELGDTFLGPETAQAQAAPVYTDSSGSLFNVPPVYGTGSLNVTASLIDVGNLSLQGVGQTSLTATNGDIRGDGTFDVAGNLALTAAEIYPVTDTTFTLAAYDHGATAGSITILRSGSDALPLSAGGQLNIYASDIVQAGVLVAPLGTINLGSGVTSAAPTDPIAGARFDATQQLVLASGSYTSVSAVDPSTGQALDIPYGTDVNGVQWNDPAGNNITTAGNGAGAIPGKSIVISGQNIQDQAGSSIDVSGGGDLYAYQFATGTGGTVDVLNEANNSYAILPSSYSATPRAAFSPAYAADGYSTNDSPVAVGQEIYLSGGAGLQAGYYTLLPSIYALEPGAYLVKATSSIQAVSASQALPAGGSLVEGYLLNGLAPPSGQSLMTSFQVDPPSVVKGLAEYDTLSGSTFFSQSATSAGIAVPRLPIDAGQLVLAAEATLSVDGSVVSNTPAGGLGSLVDIASPSNILIAGSDADLSQVPTSTLVLDSANLSAFGADSLLIGGYRGDTTSSGTAVTVTTGSLTVDNSGAGNALTGPDVILVSNDELTLDAGAQVEQGSRVLSSAGQDLVFGTSGVAASGDGALLRVTSDSSATIQRLGVDSSDPALLSIGAGAILSGNNLTLDSTNNSTLATSSLGGSSVNIDSGQISLVLSTPHTGDTPGGLVLTDSTLQALQSSATALSLLSYNDIDIYGSGSVGGAANSSGVYPIASLALHAGAIQGDGGTVAINAQSISLDDSPSAPSNETALVAGAGGSLAFNAGTIQLGAVNQTAVNGINVTGYDNVVLNASGGIQLQGAGSTTSGTGTVTRGQFGLNVSGVTAGDGNVTLEAPLITGATAADGSITASGALAIEAPTGTSSVTVSSGLGAILNLTGSSVTDDGSIALPSGTLTINATTGSIVVGDVAPAALNVSGTEKLFNDVYEYTSGGQITLNASAGSITLSPDTTIDVAAPTGGGNGGTLTIKAPEGNFAFMNPAGTAGATLEGSGGVGGTNGTFSLDTGTVGVSTILNGNDLGPLEKKLNTGGFTQSQTIRVRGGTVNNVAYDDVYLNGTTGGGDEAQAWNYNLSADKGSIYVNGDINASGVTGGSINLAAAGSVVLGSGADLTVAGQQFSDAGHGGSVTLAAGSETNGVAPISGASRDGAGNFAAGTAVVDLESGSTINLSVVTTTPSSGLVVDLTSSGSSYLNLPEATTFTLPSGTPGNDIIAFSSAGTVTSNGVTTPFTAGTSLNGLAAGSTVQLASPGTVMFAGGSTGGSVPIALAGGVNYTLGALGDATGTVHLRAPQLANGSDLQVDPLDGTFVNASQIQIEGYKVYTPAGGNITSTLENTVNTDATTFTNNTDTILQSLLGITTTPTAAQLAFYQVTPGVEIVNPTGNLTLASTWDLSTFRYNGVAGDLTLRAAGNIVFDYASNGSASLSDGFTGYTGSTSSLWTATLMPGQSWSYQLTAGSDFGAASLAAVQPASDLATLGGSVELGYGAPALPTASSGATASLIIPRFYQVIRTGTGNINIAAGGNVQILNPLGTIYTAGSAAPALANFVNPVLTYQSSTLPANISPIYQAVYSEAGGNVSIFAQGNIGDYLSSGGVLTDDSTKELPTSWLFRQGFLQNGHFAATHTGGVVEGTSWWVDFGNFFEDVGALGGGNVSLVAGNNISNVDASVPTNARVSGSSPTSSALLELGGGDLLVQAGNDISGGVYYVERGTGTLDAGGSIHTNSTRATLSQTALTFLGQQPADPTTWLPTTLFLGQGSFDLNANGSVLVGSVANPFMLPQALYNSFLNKTYFSTYAESDSVNVSALTGTVTLKDNIVDEGGSYYEGSGSLADWYGNVLIDSAGNFAQSQPWLTSVETSNAPFDAAEALLPATLNATTFSGDLDIVGGLVTSPAPNGTINLFSAGSINGLQPNTVTNPAAVASASNPVEWGSTTINLSDADPSSLPGPLDPTGFLSPATGHLNSSWAGTDGTIFTDYDNLFNETGTTNGVLQTNEALHTPGLLHADDTNPLRLYADGGSILGITLYSGKFADIEASQDITDISFYIQNVNADNVTLVSAGRDIIPYDLDSALRLEALTGENTIYGYGSGSLGTQIGTPNDGDLQINGEGALEVLAGRNLDLGVSSIADNGVGVGITSVGNQRDPYLPFAGADIVAGAGISGTPQYQTFLDDFVAPGTATSGTYLSDLGAIMGLSGDSADQIWTAFNQLSPQQKDIYATDLFYLVLRDSGRNHSSGTGTGYQLGYDAIAALFPSTTDWKGDITLTTREIKTENGGNIDLLAPGGGLTVGYNNYTPPVDQGILTADGGNISVFANNSVSLGRSRIFTLNGGNVIVWSTVGDIAAGSSSKTVQSAPPTRVAFDPQSAAVKIDLAGLSTGGGIGVLQTVLGAAASDVDLIAPSGTVDAGDAGIRASGNLNIAAARVLNAGNITVGGKSSGVPTSSAPNVAGVASASSAAGSAENAASQVGRPQQNPDQGQDNVPSIITVEVLGYGGE
jgi:filamentous hemagglutinin family protein